ncbi:ATP-dependent RNA helicase DbpA [Alteromonas aestuariivivens]|uniref:ATP-dependent RNA helicase DbpA n=1 Tax=Alteromonas aestuariivivens TaxID=1938339 RepID=A0A3D8M7E8_9ALTE|nr:ATP-dependent RNA helicase DbpA [Alteromonas aestuariivivens]RDV25645.1 ATP-dependent RNA helicase DbpA [Alteromonas aestuariivivens]
MTSFGELPIRTELSRALKQLGFESQTPIQQQALPVILDGKDVIAQAQTGSGKTLAFALGGLQQVDVTVPEVQLLILCPTRELAEQVAEQCRKVGAALANLKVLTLCGGTPMGPQIQSLKHGCHVAVGTPGRVLDHVNKRRLDLSHVRIRVLDEADRMLELGFAEDLASIFAATPAKVQTLMFSATYSPAVVQITGAYLTDPVTIKVAAEDTVNQDIVQLVYRVEEQGRLNALMAVLSHYQPATAIVFCNTKQQTRDVSDVLTEAGFSAGAIEGDMTQEARNEVLVRFASDALRVLVATDVAARGLDIADVACVINYTVSEEPETHVHRIGRTGRAGAEGLAITLCSEKEQIFLARIEELMDTSIPSKGAQSLRFHANRILEPVYVCIGLSAGKKQKIRAGDILGALTKDASLPGEDIGKITVRQQISYVAVKLRSVKRALKQFREGQIKGKRVRARKLG